MPTRICRRSPRCGALAGCSCPLPRAANYSPSGRSEAAKAASVGVHLPAFRFYKNGPSEAELHAELHLVGFGQEPADRFAREAPEARVFESKSSAGVTS